MDRVFTRDHAADLHWYFCGKDADIGLSSSWEPLAALALAGIPDGGTIAQPTKARMAIGGETPCERESRVRDALGAIDREHAVVLVARYLPGRWDTSQRTDSPRRGILTPIEEHFRELSRVALHVATQERLEECLAATKLPKAFAEEKRIAKAALVRAQKRAEEAVERAEGAYAEVAGPRGSHRASRRRLEVFEAWLDEPATIERDPVVGVTTPLLAPEDDVDRAIRKTAEAWGIALVPS